MKYFNLPCSVKLNNKIYTCDFDHESIYILQNISDIGFFKIYNDFLSNEEFLNYVIPVSVYKYHRFAGLNELLYLKQIEIPKEDFYSLKRTFKNILPDPEVFCSDMKNLIPDFIPSQNNSEYYNFEEIYAVARNFLQWSDSDFWSASPTKYCFALVSFAQYHKQKQDFLEKIQTKNSLNLLKNIKSML